MIELRHDALVYSFPEVHPEARLKIHFQRTLRVPDDGGEYPLPPGFGPFPLRHVDDFAGSSAMPHEWPRHGGVMMPVYQSEAMWVSFESEWITGHAARYPFAVKIGAGKINALTGDPWFNGLSAHPQDYLVVPDQPWLDGFCVAKGVVRQFVAMPLGAGYSAEEQITGEGIYGGLQIAVYPMKREAFTRRYPRHARVFEETCGDVFDATPVPGTEMGAAPGGRVKQQIVADSYGLNEWEYDRLNRCFVHLANSGQWRSITGEKPPNEPFTVAEYQRAGLPWFEYYTEAPVLEGGPELGRLKGIAAMQARKGEKVLPDNDPVTPGTVIQIDYDPGEGPVREGDF